MTAIGEWLAYGVPWWVWSLAAVPVVLLLARVAGLQAAVVAGALAGALLAYGRGAQAGWRQRQDKETRDAQRAVDLAAGARRDAERRNDDPRRLRDDDGWRRD